MVTAQATEFLLLLLLVLVYHFGGELLSLTRRELLQHK
jgi:hypothetical protein